MVCRSLYSSVCTKDHGTGAGTFHFFLILKRAELLYHQYKFALSMQRPGTVREIPSLKENPATSEHTLLDRLSFDNQPPPHPFATMKTACVALALMGSASAFIAPMSNVRTASR